MYSNGKWDFLATKHSGAAEGKRSLKLCTVKRNDVGKSVDSILLVYTEPMPQTRVA